MSALAILFFYSSNRSWLPTYKSPFTLVILGSTKGQVIRFQITLPKGVWQIISEPGKAWMTGSQILFSLSPKWPSLSLGFCLKLQFPFVPLATLQSTILLPISACLPKLPVIHSLSPFVSPSSEGSEYCFPNLQLWDEAWILIGYIF